MIKYWKIWWRIVKMSVMQDVMYKIDYLSGLLHILYWLGQVYILKVLFGVSGVENITGYSQNEMLFVVLVMQVVFLWMYWAINWSVEKLQRQIYSGTFDFLMIRPGNLFFYAIFQKFDVTSGVVMVGYSILFGFWVVDSRELMFSGLDWLKLLFVVFLSIYMLSLLEYFVTIAEFYQINNFALRQFNKRMNDACQYPQEIYPNWMRQFLKYVWPVFLIVNPVFLLIKRQFGWEKLVEIILVNIVFTLIVYLFWIYGLRRYQSAA